jgi:hypothetical protein
MICSRKDGLFAHAAKTLDTFVKSDLQESSDVANDIST